MEFRYKFLLSLVWYLILSLFRNRQALYGHLLFDHLFLGINSEFSNLDAIFLCYVDNKLPRRSGSAIRGFVTK